MKQLLEKLTTLAAYTAAVCTIVILLVTSININCFNKGFYKTEYASLETAQSLGMTEKDLNKATDALLDYLEERDRIIPEAGHEDALFLSLQRKRMAVRSVENLVKKYARTVSPLKPITPHKLRSTYGTNLYRETGDIYLVADVLGHSDVNTTKRHYAALEDERRRSARNKVRLREK